MSQPRRPMVEILYFDASGPSYRGCCDVLNFFETTETARQYLRDHDHVDGMTIAIPEAIEAGRAIFGEIFTEN